MADESKQPPEKKIKHKDSLEGVLLGMGNPLLDISAEVPQEFLDKYGVKLNNACLAGDQHIPMYDEMVEKFPVEYIAGGATQNSIRVAQWMLQTPGASSYIGSVGKDKFGEQLRKSAEGDGLHVYYSFDEKTPTGTCACLIHHKERSLIANLAAANNFKIDHLKKPDIEKVWQKAEYYYIAGFFLTVSLDSILLVAQHAHDSGKTFAMNLAAPFICEFFHTQLTTALPFCDFIFGNESEAKTFAKAAGWKEETPEYACEHLALWKKKNTERPRIVVITQGSDPTLVYYEGKVHEFPCPKIPKDEIVDSNGAGDAFVGGFLSQLVQGKSIPECVRAGQYAAGVILRVSGTRLSGKPSFK